MNDAVTRSELLPPDERGRLAALRRYHVLDTQAETDFDLLAEITAQLCQAPYAFISLVDENRVWYKARFGRHVLESPRNDDYCSWTILEDRLLMLPDLTADARTAGISVTTGGAKYRMYAGANLITTDGYRIGTLCVLDTHPRQLTETQQKLLLGLARQVMSLLELRRRTNELESALERIEKIASEDALTTLLSRRALLEGLDLEVERALRLGTHVSVVMVDVDHFKKINDNFDHAMGDAVLRGVGLLLRETVRAIDHAGRYGGEELGIVLPGTDLSGAIAVAEKLRAVLATKVFEDHGRQVRITASLGVATLLPGRPRTPDQLLRAADAALLKAKQEGRDRVVAET